MIWHEADPVDSFEINRNNIIYSFQENRNPFIDRPEYVEKIWITTDPGMLNQGEIKIYPNPARDFINVEAPFDEIVSGSIISITGQRLAEFSGRGHFKVQMDGMDSGCYGIRIASKNISFQSVLVVQN